MEQPVRSIFRGNALKHYMQNRERDVLPRLISPMVFGLYWLLLGVFFVAIGIAWWGEVPIYVMGSGLLVTTSKHVLKTEQNDLQALIFVPVISSQTLPQLSPNAPVLLRLASAQLDGQIIRIDPGVVSPTEARKRYKLAGGEALLISVPSLVLHARLTTPLPPSFYVGSIVQGSIQSGSQRILSLLIPGLDGLLEGRIQ